MSSTHIGYTCEVSEYNSFTLQSFDYNLTFSHTAAILDSKMVSIVVFSNYGDVKQIHVNKI